MRNSAGTGSTAKDKLCALRQRIQFKVLLVQQRCAKVVQRAGVTVCAPGCSVQRAVTESTLYTATR